jgi:hypothetical protein
MVMNFSPVETMRDADVAGRAGFDIMLAVASARQAASPTARLSLRLAAHGVAADDVRDARRVLLAGQRLSANMPVAGCFAPFDVRTGTQK